MSLLVNILRERKVLNTFTAPELCEAVAQQKVVPTDQAYTDDDPRPVAVGVFMRQLDIQYAKALGLGKIVEAGTMKRAYRRLVIECHPDKVSKDKVAQATLWFRAIQDAYEYLRARLKHTGSLNLLPQVDELVKKDGPKLSPIRKKPVVTPSQQPQATQPKKVPTAPGYRPPQPPRAGNAPARAAAVKRKNLHDLWVYGVLATLILVAGWQLPRLIRLLGSRTELPPQSVAVIQADLTATELMADVAEPMVVQPQNTLTAKAAAPDGSVNMTPVSQNNATNSRLEELRRMREEMAETAGTKGDQADGVTVTPKNDGWEIVRFGGRDYLKAESIRNFYNAVYGFTTFRVEDDQFWLGSSKMMLKAQVGSKDLLINNIKFVLSFPVVSYNDSVLFSRLDVSKLIDPVLYPSHIQNAEYFDTVIIDPSHGGDDLGAQGIHGIEKDLALKMALEVRTALKQRGFKVIMTREADTSVSEKDRVKMANNTPKSIFISLHFNSGPSDMTGIETYALTPQSASDTQSGDYNLDGVTGNRQDSANIALAAAVHGSVISRFKFVDRGIKRTLLSLLSDCARPGILFKGGFVTNDKEGLLIASDTYRQQVSAAIGDAVVNYRRALEKAIAKK